MPTIKIWLDDQPEAPARAAQFPADEGWIHCRQPAEVIAYLKTGSVAEMSLDHDLGEGAPGKPVSGYDVVAWLEKEVAAGRWCHPLPIIRVHSRNPVGRGNIEACVENIRRLWERSPKA